MTKIYTKDEAIDLKKSCFKKLNSMLETFMAKPAPAHSYDTDYMKKAALISKWLIQYSNYIFFEEKFDPRKNIAYKRGDIVFANFGFNVGSELGGEHYAVVLDKENHHNSSTITVIPLSSYKTGKSIHPNDLYLGNELFEKMHLKFKTHIASLREQATNQQLIRDLVIDKIKSINKVGQKTNSELDSLIIELENSTKKLSQEIANTERLQKEILSLKLGSIAKIRQITTISKMRIYNPRNTNEPLYGIHLSQDSMDKINEKVKEHFIF